MGGPWRAWALQLTRRPKAGWAGGPPGEGLNLPLTSLSTWWPPHHQPTLSSISSLTVAHWKLAACGQGPLRHRPMAEQDLLPRNRMWTNEAQQWLPAKACAHPALLQKEGDPTLLPEALQLTWLGRAGNLVGPDNKLGYVSWKGIRFLTKTTQ